jgi:hypothetical protein
MDGCKPNRKPRAGDDERCCITTKAEGDQREREPRLLDGGSLRINTSGG